MKRALIVLATMSLLAACGGQPPPPNLPAGMVLDPQAAQATLETGPHTPGHLPSVGSGVGVSTAQLQYGESDSFHANGLYGFAEASALGQLGPVGTGSFYWRFDSVATFTISDQIGIAKGSDARGATGNVSTWTDFAHGQTAYGPTLECSTPVTFIGFTAQSEVGYWWPTWWSDGSTPWTTQTWLAMNAWNGTGNANTCHWRNTDGTASVSFTPLQILFGTFEPTTDTTHNSVPALYMEVEFAWMGYSYRVVQPYVYTGAGPVIQ